MKNLTVAKRECKATQRIEKRYPIFDNSTSMPDLGSFFTEVSEQLSEALDRLSPSVTSPPEKLHQAIRWSLFGGGKHLRPALLFAFGRAFGAADAQLVRTAAAVEMIHTYSLI